MASFLEHHQSYTDKLSALSIAKTMAAPALCVGNVYGTFDCLTGDRANAMNVSDPLIQPQHLGFLITVRNVRTDEQLMHSEVVDSLSDWYLHFRDRAIFACIDNEKHVNYPSLPRPSYGDVPWTCTRFTYTSSFAWDVIVTIALKNVSHDIDRDRVHMIVISPPVPNSLDAYHSICTTSFAKTACATRNMCIQHAERQLGYARADDDIVVVTAAASTRVGVMVHGEDKQNGPRNSVRAHLYGSFNSFKPEHTAGSAVIPQILKQASFILPCIQDEDPCCEYTILQPHKFGYILQIKNIGGGWVVLASVNLLASAKAMLRHFRDAPSQCGAIIVKSNIIMNSALMNEPAACTLSRMDAARMLSRLIDTAYTDRYAAIGCTIRLTRLLDDAAVIDNAVIAELKADSTLWTLFNALAGTKMYEGQLKELGQRSMTADEVIRGNAFIEIYRKACKQRYQPTAADIILFAKTMLEVCTGMASVLVQNKLVTQTSQLTLRSGREIDSDIDVEKILTFLQTSCVGTTPRTWVASAYPHFIKNPLLLVQTLLAKPAAFAAFMPGFPRKDVAEYIVESMLVIDKAVTTTRYSVKHAKSADAEHVFIQKLALFIFKTTAQGGLAVQEADHSAARYSRIATEDGLLLGASIKARAATLAGAEIIKAVCDAQAVAFAALLPKGDDATQKIKALADAAHSVQTQIAELIAAQDHDGKRVELSRKTVDHNAAVITTGTGEAMVWPPDSNEH
jgi:hypothetical protein